MIPKAGLTPNGDGASLEDFVAEVVEDEAGEDRCGRCGCKRKEHVPSCGKCKKFSEMKKRKK